MTHDLEGADLSRAVARVLGWTQCATDNLGPVWQRSGTSYPGIVFFDAPDYATDAALIPELLAWLRDTSHLPTKITHYATGADIHPPFYVERGVHWADGQTIQVALSRLVLALAEARGAQPKERP